MTVLPFGDAGKRPKLRRVERDAGGIARRINHQDLAFVRDGGLESGRFESKIRVGVYGDRNSAKQVDEVLVHYKIRIGEEHFIAGIDRCQQG